MDGWVERLFCQKPLQDVAMLSNNLAAEKEKALTAEARWNWCRAEHDKLLEQAGSLKVELERLKNSISTAGLPAMLKLFGPKAIADMGEAAYGKLWVACLEELRLLFTHPIPTAPATFDQIASLLLSHYPGLRLQGRTDVAYQMAQRQDGIIGMVESTWVRWMPSKTDAWDCDDYAQAFDLELTLAGITAKAIVEGLAGGVAHAWNLIPSADGLLMADMTSMQRFASVPPGLPGYVPSLVTRL